MDLIDLIYRCQKQERSAQYELYNLYKDSLYTLCLKYCKNTEDARDVLQESFISIFENINRFEVKGSFEGWLKRITIHKAIDKYRDTKVIHLPIKEENIHSIDIEEDLEEFSLDFLLQIIQDLPNQYRLVFNLYTLDEFTHKEIADLLHISEGTSKSNLHRAKLLLKEKILNLKQASKNYG